tara:strand:+ start:11583 stop:13679 length:2097 start_codon:yes stop_codon:yes gene_type:complete
MKIQLPGVAETVPNQVSLQAPVAQRFDQTDGLQMLGQTANNMSAQANRLRAIGEQGAKNARASMVKEAQVRANQEISRVLEDREKGYLLKQGAAARDSYQNVETEFDGVFKKLSEAFEDDEARAQFETAVAVDFQRARTTAGLHWAKQSKVANAAQSKVRYSQLASDIAAGDWGARRDLRDEIDEYGKVIGLTPEQRDELHGDVLSQAAGTYVETIMNEGDLDEASRLMEVQGPHIERSLRAKLEKRLKAEKKAAKEVGKLERIRTNGLNRAFSALDKHAKETAGQAQANALEDIEKQFLKDNDAATYHEARRNIINESKDRFNQEQAQLTGHLAKATVFFTDNPQATAAEFTEQHPQVATSLLATESGREAFKRMTSAAGKARAGNTYRNIMLAKESNNIEALKTRMSSPEALGMLTAGMTDTQAKEVMSTYREIHNLDPEDSGRETLKSLATASLKPYSYAHDGHELTEPINVMVRDRLIALVNESGAQTRDEQIKVMDAIMLDTIFTVDGQKIPREFIRWKNLGLDPTQIIGKTKFGEFRAADISEDVRRELMGVATKLYGSMSPKETARKAEELWFKFDKPTTKTAVETGAKGYSSKLPEDVVSTMPLEYLQGVVHPDAVALFGDGSQNVSEFQIVQRVQKTLGIELDGAGVAINPKPEATELVNTLRLDLALLKAAAKKKHQREMEEASYRVN